jgi:hypothetical protein
LAAGILASSGNAINLMDALKVSLLQGGKSAPAPSTKTTPAAAKHKDYTPPKCPLHKNQSSANGTWLSRAR